VLEVVLEVLEVVLGVVLEVLLGVVLEVLLVFIRQVIRCCGGATPAAA
jgi:hypothetical protein